MPDPSKKDPQDVQPPARSGGSAGKSGTATKAKRAVRKSPAKKPPQQLPPWKVLLHNDDKNEVEFVVETIVALQNNGELDHVCCRESRFEQPLNRLGEGAMDYRIFCAHASNIELNIRPFFGLTRY